MNEVHLGDTVTRPLTVSTRDSDRPLLMRGTVVWIHPALRYHMVRFHTAGGDLVECYSGVRKRRLRP